MKKIKDIIMIILSALVLATTFMFFAFLAIFSQTARWIIEESMTKVAEVLQQAETRRIEKAKRASRVEE